MLNTGGEHSSLLGRIPVMMALLAYYGLLIAGLAAMLAPNLGWLALATYYVWMPLGALAPLSTPPCPGSSTISGRLCTANVSRSGTSITAASLLGRGSEDGGGSAEEVIASGTTPAIELARSAAARVAKSSGVVG